MKREVTYYCEAPDCDSRQTSAAPTAPIAGWLLVVEQLPSTPPVEYDICSWNCMLKFASEVPPPEVVEVLM